MLTARSVSSEEGGERHFRLPSVVGGESRPDSDIRAIWREINELTIVLAEKRRLFATICFFDDFKFLRHCREQNLVFTSAVGSGLG
jgi:hypothetical protein